MSGFSWWMQFVILKKIFVKLLLNSEIYFDSKGTCTSWTCKLQLYWSGLASVLENVWKRQSFVFLQTEALLRLMLSANERGTCCQPKLKRRFPSFPFSLSLYRSTEIIKDVSHFYYINCSVLHKFSALKKPRTTQEKKTHNFSCLCLISPVSCWHVTRLWCHSVMFINELEGLHLFSN